MISTTPASRDDVIVIRNLLQQQEVGPRVSCRHTYPIKKKFLLNNRLTKKRPMPPGDIMGRSCTVRALCQADAFPARSRPRPFAAGRQWYDSATGSEQRPKVRRRTTLTTRYSSALHRYTCRNQRPCTSYKVFTGITSGSSVSFWPGDHASFRVTECIITAETMLCSLKDAQHL